MLSWAQASPGWAQMHFQTLGDQGVLPCSGALPLGGPLDTVGVGFDTAA